MLNTLVLVTLSSITAASAAAMPALNVIMNHTFATAYSCKGNYEVSALKFG